MIKQKPSVIWFTGYSGAGKSSLSSEVEKQLKLACKSDKARINLARISKFGLLEMSRQRISPPVKDGIFEECSQCVGSGLVRSINSIVLLVFRKVQELIAKGGAKLLSLIHI